MTLPTKPPKKSTSAFACRVYNPVGFCKAYNFILWFIFAGALFGFLLARFQLLNFSIFCNPKARGGNSAAPGECYYYRTFSWYKIGIYLHLYGVLFSALIAVFQFTPIIRHKAIILHRIEGYAALLLWLVSTVGAFIIARRAFGGGVDTQVWVGTVGIGTTTCFVISYVNIKRLQIEQHRAWMLRGWFYAGSVITQRIVLIIAAKIGAALNLSFGMALWVALVLHAVGVEVYLHLTPREHERLRNVSYQRQLEAGMKHSGSAGLTDDRLGDAKPWVCESRRDSGQSGATPKDGCESA